MEILDTIWQTIQNLTIYVINGVLVVFYFILGQGTMIVSLLCAAIVGLIFDVIAQRLAAAAPSRQGRTAPANISRHHQLLTLVCGISWLIAGSLFPTPVPQLGTAMWILFVVALFLVPAEQQAILWRSKVGVISYCLLLVGFRIAAAWTLAADARGPDLDHRILRSLVRDSRGLRGLRIPAGHHAPDELAQPACPGLRDHLSDPSSARSMSGSVQCPRRCAPFQVVYWSYAPLGGGQ
jgi:hypothetical protein